MTIKGTEQHLQGPACIKITVPVLYIKMYNTWESMSQQGKLTGMRGGWIEYSKSYRF